MFKVPNQFRIGSAIKDERFVSVESDDSYGLQGAFIIPRDGKKTGKYYYAFVSSGMGWEHVSVSIPAEKRTLLWEEMCYIKSFFWDDDDAVMQLHPPKKDWVNNHPYVLHLWRPITAEIPLPPPELVGLKRMNTAENKTK